MKKCCYCEKEIRGSSYTETTDKKLLHYRCAVDWSCFRSVRGKHGITLDKFKKLTRAERKQMLRL
jgi:hypothetical protein